MRRSSASLVAPVCGLVALVALLAACGDSEGGPSTAAGGGSGDNGSGGHSASGGSSSTGGDASTGGSATGGGATGGSTGGDGGTAATGGTDSMSGGGSGGFGGDEGTGGGSDSGGGTSVSCPSTSLPAGDSTRTVMVGGTSRSYILRVPPAYDGDTAAPLIVDFHPLGGSGQGQRNGSTYPAATAADGVIMAFPSGLSGPSGGAWNVGPCCVANTDDVAFARALVEDVQEVACIDPKRIYAVGFSMGGGMSHYLACHAADLFAAVAPAAFDLLEENVTGCTPSRPITVVSFRGTGDVVVPYDGGYSAVVSGMPVTFLGAQATFQAWAQRNQCSGSPSASDNNGCSFYSGCQDDVDVVLCTQQGGGHNQGNASIAWPILKQHTLP